MTLVLSWLNQEPGFPSIWTAADTKISDENGTLTLEGSKVFELQVVCKNLSHSWGQVYYRTSLGFAYAGSSLIGLNTYATLNTVLCNLGGGDLNHMLVPDHISIVNAARDILRLYVTSIQSNVEISIWGYCPKSKEPFIGTVRTILKDGLIDYRVEFEYGLKDQIKCVMLGSNLDAIKEILELRLAAIVDRSNYHYWRTPVQVLREIINGELYEAIGGNIQLATLNEHGQFSHLSVVVAKRGDELKSSLKYRNIDIHNELGQRIGDCLIALSGLHMEL